MGEARFIDKKCICGRMYSVHQPQEQCMGISKEADAANPPCEPVGACMKNEPCSIHDQEVAERGLEFISFDTIHQFGRSTQ